MNKPIADQQLMSTPSFHHINDSKGMSWRAFKKQLKPNYQYIAYYFVTSVLMLLLGGTALNQITSTCGSLALQALMILLVSVWFSIWMIVINNHFHEAAHYKRKRKIYATRYSMLQLCIRLVTRVSNGHFSKICEVIVIGKSD